MGVTGNDGVDTRCRRQSDEVVVVRIRGDTRDHSRIRHLVRQDAHVADEGDNVVDLRTEDGRALTVPTGWAHGRLTHAYAMTVHKGQGLTTGVALLYGTGALCQQAGYVAMSRGRDANHLYTAIDPAEADHDRGFRLAGGADPTDVLDALADRLTYAPRQQLASHQVRYRDAPWQASRDPYDWLHQPDSRDRGYEIER
jgi:hypothetical protein